MRVVLLVIVACAIVWMAIPIPVTMGTSIGFRPGAPDPNSYTTEYIFGLPLPWLIYSYSWNELRGTSSADTTEFRILSFGIHVLAIILPVVALSRISRKHRTSKETLSKRLDRNR